MPLLVAPAGCSVEAMEPRPVELVAEVAFLLRSGPAGAGTTVGGDERGAGGVAGGGVAGGCVAGGGVAGGGVAGGGVAGGGVAGGGLRSGWWRSRQEEESMREGG